MENARAGECKERVKSQAQKILTLLILCYLYDIVRIGKVRCCERRIHYEEICQTSLCGAFVD